jgi:hypothetical protein
VWRSRIAFMIGWKRIVVTVGGRGIGKAHLS